MRDGGLRSLFRQHLPMVHWESIESPFTNRGIPDLNGCHLGHEFWVENKQTTGWAVTLRPEQVAWMLRRQRAGGHTFIAVRRQSTPGPRRGPGVDDLYLIPGALAREAKMGGLKAITPCGVWEGGPAGWDWGAILASLTQ